MKKWIAILTALILALCCAAAFADDAAAETDPEALALFDSDWVDGNAHIMFFPLGEEWNVQIENENRTIEWLYTCAYDKEQKALVTIPGEFNAKTRIFWDDEGYQTGRTTEYEDGAASFTVNEEGKLIWRDEKENAGADHAYMRIGWFAGDWECDGADNSLYQISCVWDLEETEEETGIEIHSGYKLNIVKYGMDGVISYWDYAGMYDPETDSLNTFGSKAWQLEEDGPIENVYDNGSAVFTMEDGFLYWKDATEEDAGAGLAFHSNNG